MVLAKGDFVRINYTGRIKETGEVFDTTSEEVAKKEGIYDPQITFKPQPIVIGAGHVLPGLDKALVGAEVGEEKHITVPPEEGYGIRDPSKVKVIPLREFKKQGIKPVPGMRIEMDDAIGRVQSVSGGRVRVDMNHGLAGKVLEYDVTVLEKTNKTEEKIRQLLELHFPYADPHEHEIKIKGDTVEITLPDTVKLNPAAGVGKFSTSRDIFTFVEGIDRVDFREVHRRLVPSKGSKPKKAPSRKGAGKKTGTRKKPKEA
ncbi:MAG: peptidylprolyl isomerase [Methanobacteriota archaeon]|nr:MAG: peptidylprolyl isomerase [Euryarchaeota archaeon]